MLNLRQILLWLIRAYQLGLSPWLGPRCRFYPSCSCYAHTAIEKHGALAGSWLALAWGFGGLRTVNGRPSFAPMLPDAWNGYRFGLHWRQGHIRVAVDADGVTYTAEK